MGKGKPRHKPDKEQNKWGGDNTCSYYERPRVCEAGENAHVCNGNRHNCIKEKYLRLAGRKSN